MPSSAAVRKKARPRVDLPAEDGGGGLDAHPDLLAEVARVLDDEDQEFLLKG